MTEIEKPRAGGSYIRNKDGSLTRVRGIEEAPPATSAQPAGNADTPDETPAEPTDTPKKGK